MGLARLGDRRRPSGPVERITDRRRPSLLSGSDRLAFSAKPASGEPLRTGLTRWGRKAVEPPSSAAAEAFDGTENVGNRVFVSSEGARAERCKYFARKG
jgi:hypothetical protein